MRLPRAVVLCATLAIFGACGGAEEQSGEVEGAGADTAAASLPQPAGGEGTMAAADTTPPKPLKCGAHPAGSSRMEVVGPNGTGNQPLFITAPKIGRSAELHIKAGTVPPDSQYIFLISGLPGASAGCQVAVTKISAGAIRSSSDAYTLRLRCKGTNGNPMACPANVGIYRVESSSEMQSTVDQGNNQWLEANLQDLSTYILATPGDRLLDTPPPPDTAGGAPK